MALRNSCEIFLSHSMSQVVLSSTLPLGEVQNIPAAVGIPLCLFSPCCTGLLCVQFILKSFFFFAHFCCGTKGLTDP